jgi:hypothetical protein
VNIEGSGTNARAHINFGKFGMKLLDLSIAKLEKSDFIEIARSAVYSATYWWALIVCGTVC